MRVSFMVKVSVRVMQVAILSCNCEATQPRRKKIEQGPRTKSVGISENLLILTEWNDPETNKHIISPLIYHH